MEQLPPECSKGELLKNLILSLSILAFLLSGCERSTPTSPPQIAVTNSYIASAVTQITGSTQNDILLLAAAGMCPGHFDLSPGQLNSLKNAKLMFIFDFQKTIADNLQHFQGLTVKTLAPDPGMCIPATFSEICQQVAKACVDAEPSKTEQINKSLANVEKKLNDLENDILNKIQNANLKGVPVIASEHQAEFCSWLGLNVVAVFKASDTETLRHLSESIGKAQSANVRFVIANRQGGTSVANTLAKNLRCTVVTFSNFPDTTDANDFCTLLQNNINHLLEACREKP
jgi:ABC-type Zn uptake system ZnuABC Zn-binding protein ZnuA